MQKLTKTALLSLLALTWATSANAVLINFDEFAADNTNGPMPADRYSSLGVTFVATDDGSTFDGITNGDPGNWDLEGTNGSIFSGFNGDSYGLSMLFDTNIDGFSLDVSRSEGSQDGDIFTLEGWDDGVLIDSTTIGLGPVNDWSTLILPSSVDEVRWLGSGAAFHPFGIDNIQWDRVEVPVPPIWSLFLIGAFSAALARRRART